ncbi:hypothetical protein FDP41_012224 [Naegleria fowleri]|uniref:Uncharacterized protein n=1 Tax=Naegleria fowleri TaxID=5763 RepID=A0A6A5BWD4_NAEFO|nr:uncharacterized protein FDP41_012224 [Naegleria fowleri]KAF0981567.1 hypothetical protein FDP41_012224 [Naegleria fowleri]
MRFSGPNLYYDYKNKLGRFDFFDNYYDMNNSWGSINMTILWIDTVVWFVYPKVKQCTLRSKNLPLISPDWLKMTHYVGRTLFREMYSDVWQFPNVDDLDGMRYYHKVGSSSETKIPLRSTNQINDPGATDYFDFTIGPSHVNLYQIPKFCKEY